MKLNLNNTYKILVSWQEKELALKEILWDKKTILYFYPADNTPGCTLENKDFTCLKNEFNAKWYKLVWVSKNSMESHKKFVIGQELLNDLISSVLKSNHSPFILFEANLLCQYTSIPVGSSVLIEWNWRCL